MATPRAPEALVSAVRRGHRFVVTSHINPDGDAIGSAVGLSRILHRFGKGANIWMRDAVPRIYRSLPGSERIHVGEKPPNGFPDVFDAAIVLECPSPDRTGIFEQLKSIPILNIDHHLGNEHYGVVNWVDTTAPAVGDLVFRLARTLNVELDATNANALYLALLTDTGGFRFSNTTVDAFDLAANLVRAGASPETVAGWIYESQPIGSLRLLGALLATLELHNEGRVATVLLTREMVRRAEAQPGDAEGLIDYPRSIAGVEAVALFRELDDGRYKVSLRGRGLVNVEKIARQHGGGGHHNAAGFTSNVGGALVDIVAQTVAALTSSLAARTDRSVEPEEHADD